MAVIDEYVSMGMIKECPSCYSKEYVKMVDVLFEKSWDITAIELEVELIWECGPCNKRFSGRSLEADTFLMQHQNELVPRLRFDSCSHSPILRNDDDLDCKIEAKVDVVENRIGTQLASLEITLDRKLEEKLRGIDVATLIRKKVQDFSLE